MGGRSVKNLISVYSGESFSFLNISFFRIKLTWGCYRCCGLWRGAAGLRVLQELLCQRWRWTPAPHDELHNIAFLKRILPRAEPAAETEAEAVAGWGHDSTPQLAGLTPPGPWGGSQHSSQSLFLALSWVLGWNPASLLHSGQMEEESPYSFSPANFVCSGGQDGGLCFVSLVCCSAMHWRFFTECW